MNPEASEALDTICRRALGKALDGCPPVMVPAATVSEAMFSLLKEAEASETSGPLHWDEISERLVCMQLVAACRVGGFSLMQLVKPEIRNELRACLKMAVVATELMAQSEMEYGPVPAGLTGRDLGLAAFAIEMLQARSPQRLLARQRSAMH